MKVIKYNLDDRRPGDIDTAMYSGPGGTGKKISDHDPGFDFAQIRIAPSGVAWMAITEGHEWRIKFPYTDPPGNPPSNAFRPVPDHVLNEWGLK